MRVAKKLKRLVGNLWGRENLESELEAELRAYVDELTERKIAKGLPASEARRQALLETGPIEKTKEEVREQWLGRSIEIALQDLRRALRSLLRSPGFTVIVVATLALGIGANLAMFSLMRAVLWRPLPYPEPDRIVMIQVDARNTPNTGATMGEIRDLQEQSRTLEMVSFVNPSDANVEYAGEMEHVSAVEVSDHFLPLLGIRPALGRGLDSRIDASKQQVFTILISDEFWRRRFSSDPNVLGKSVRVNNLDVQIAGVLPSGFTLFLPPSLNASEKIDIWLPYRLDATLPYRGNPVAARLRPGVTLSQVNAELRTFVAQFERKYPEAYAGTKGSFTARTLHEEMRREVRPALLLLAGAVAFVLLIACVNVANLMLARGTARRRELEIRRALGAGASRIFRQLLTESLVLALLSAATGLICAGLGLESIARFSAAHIPLQSRIGIDWTIALGALALSIVTSLLFGLLPAWRLSAGKSSSVLRAGRAETAGSSARTLQRALVVAEVALSIVPLAGGGLMLRSFLNLTNAPLGFNPAHIITVKAPFDARRYPAIEQRWPLLLDIFERVKALPEVQSIAAAWPLPLAPDQQTRRVGRADQLDVPPILATQQFAAPGYLDVTGTPLLEGRDFTSDDVKSGRAVTIIDQSLAKRLWPDGAIGKLLAVHRTGVRHDLEVVGVSATQRVTRVRDDNMPHFMLPWGDYPPYASLAIKTGASDEKLGSRITAAVDAAHSGRAAFDVKPMSAYVSDSIGDTRFVLFVLSAFACASVLLTAVGLYGTLAYLTAQRTREFGIRVALGSSAASIIGIILRESALLAAAGSAFGLLGVAAATRAIRDLLYGVRPLDATTLLAVVAVIAAVSMGAAILPASRAARIDPQISLRSE